MIHEAFGDLPVDGRVVLDELEDHHEDGGRRVGGVVHLPVAQLCGR